MIFRYLKDLLFPEARLALSDRTLMGRMYAPAEERSLGRPRHKDWAKESTAFLKTHTKCSHCDQESEVVHHIIPVHKRPDLEMDKDNWAALCDRCHFVMGHQCNWRLWNSMFWQVVNLARAGRSPKNADERPGT